MKYKILIIEDDKEIGRLLEEDLKNYGYDVFLIDDFCNILDKFNIFLPHLVLVDINLPMYDGFYWCRKIRSISKNPIIFISARDGNMDQVMAIESGGDDYITKPFSYEVVMAKVKSQIRRSFGEYSLKHDENLVELFGLKYYASRMEMVFKSSKCILTKREGILLEILMRDYPKVSSREKLLDSIWDDSKFVEENTLNVNVRRVRKKLESVGIKNPIETVRGIGYKINKSW